MRGAWWKILSVLILLYTFVVGLLVPLKPGIEAISPTTIDGGELLVMNIQGYNTDFTAGSENRRAWLKLNNKFVIGANQVLTINARNIRASFSMPYQIPLRGETHSLSLILDDPEHGAIVRPDALTVTNIVHNKESRDWSNNPVSSLHSLKKFRFPYRAILYETIRTIYYHVPMWFGMIFLFFASGWYSTRFIRNGGMANDHRAEALATTGTLFGVMGLLTGMLWATYTWGSPWSWDIKQNVAAITLLIYFAYFILRKSFDDPERKARTAAVYNVFACVMLIPLLFVIPRLTGSLHPGSGGNPALGGEDLDNTMRAIFYPAVIGWTLLGLWVSQVLYRIKKLNYDVSF